MKDDTKCLKCASNFVIVVIFVYAIVWFSKRLCDGYRVHVYTFSCAPPYYCRLRTLDMNQAQLGAAWLVTQQAPSVARRRSSCFSPIVLWRPGWSPVPGHRPQWRCTRLTRRIAEPAQTSPRTRSFSRNCDCASKPTTSSIRRWRSSRYAAWISRNFRRKSSTCSSWRLGHRLSNFWAARPT